MKEIKTNYAPCKSYSVCNGEYKEGWVMELKESCKESDKEFLERLIELGYTRISFYEVTTRVKGLHKVIAYCKR